MINADNLPEAKTKAAVLVVEKMEQILAAFPTRDDLVLARFAQTAITLANSLKLSKCTPESVAMSLFGCARIGIIPDPVFGQAWILPRKIDGRFQAQILVGYRGYIEMAHRTGEYKAINAEVVYEHDEFDVSYGTDRAIRHRPWWLRDHDEPGDLRAAYATAVHASGHVQFRVIPWDEVLKHRDASGSKITSYSPWVQWKEAMGRKTAVVDLAKYLRLSAEFNMAARWDEQAERGEAQSIQATGCEPEPMPAAGDPLMRQLNGDPGEGDGPPPSGDPPVEPDMSDEEKDQAMRREADEAHDSDPDIGSGTCSGDPPF